MCRLPGQHSFKEHTYLTLGTQHRKLWTARPVQYRTGIRTGEVVNPKLHARSKNKEQKWVKISHPPWSLKAIFTSKSIVDNYNVEMEIIGRMFYCKHCLKGKSKITTATALPDTEYYAFRKNNKTCTASQLFC